jgi:dTDP-glucose 4,6-dehydratase
MKRMRFVISGGAGFIGSHFSKFLLDRGHSVTVLDNFITGRRENVQKLLPNERFELIECDVSDAVTIEQHVDAVLHLASPASPMDYLQYPIETLKAGALGTMHLLELAQERGAVFLLASTSEVYGDPQVHPQNEDYWGHVNPIGPRSVYDESKRFAEASTMAYHRHYGTDTRIVRIFNTYGPKMRIDDGRVIPTFIMQALRGEPLSIFGSGEQTRSFCYVSDLIEGIYGVIFAECHSPVNLGNPVEISIKELTRILGGIVGKELTFIFKELPEDDPKCRKPDISKAVELLSWKPKVEFAEGLGKTVAWFSEQAKGTDNG